MPGTDLTRRSLLALLASAGAASAVDPPGAVARLLSPEPGEPRLFTVYLGEASAGVCTVDPPARFDLAGLRWSRPARPSIEIRTRLADGRWGQWAPAAGTGHGPDGPEAARMTTGDQGGQPVWVGRSHALQHPEALHAHYAGRGKKRHRLPEPIVALRALYRGDSGRPATVSPPLNAKGRLTLKTCRQGQADAQDLTAKGRLTLKTRWPPPGGLRARPGRVLSVGRCQRLRIRPDRREAYDHGRGGGHVLDARPTRGPSGTRGLRRRCSASAGPSRSAASRRCRRGSGCGSAQIPPPGSPARRLRRSRGPTPGSGACSGTAASTSISSVAGGSSPTTSLGDAAQQRQVLGQEVVVEVPHDQPGSAPRRRLPASS